MNTKKKNITDVDVAGKKVLMRCDFNVPVDEDGAITDDTRIVKTLPTIQLLLDKGAAVILCSHFGRPKNGYEEKYSLKTVAKRLSELLKMPVPLASDVVGESAQALAKSLQSGQVMLMENVRFENGETKNDPELAEKMAALADIYVNDAFGSCHRAHASTAGVTKFLPAYSGLLVKKELEIMGGVMDSPKKPFVLIMGGSKVSDKIGVIDYLLDNVDALVIGGGMAYTFIKARGGTIGTSLCEDESLDYARGLEEKCKKLGVELHIPTDTVIAPEFKPDSPHQTVSSMEIPDDMMGLDIGPETIKDFIEVIKNAGTIVWNGPMGVFEFPAFAVGTEAIAKAVAESGAVSVIGGGDSAAAVEQMGYADKITHISTGGGASLDFFAGKVLPGVDCLLDA